MGHSVRLDLKTACFRERALNFCCGLHVALSIQIKPDCLIPGLLAEALKGPFAQG